MLNLIKNELFKIFHKKSTYIVMLIMTAFIILITSIYRFMDLNYFYYEYAEPKENAEMFLNNYNPATDVLEDYVYYLALNDTYEHANGFDKDSWQYKKMFNEYQNNAYNYYASIHLYKAEDKIYLKEMNNILNNLNTSNWRYFVEKDQKNIQEQLEYYKSIDSSTLAKQEKVEYDKQVYTLEEQLKLIDYRLKENISYDEEYLNEAFNQAYYSVNDVANYKYNSDKDESKEYLSTYYTNKYILENKVDINNGKTLRAILINFFDEYFFLILVFVVMISGAIVSDEFNKGTIKSLLILPYKRSKILLSKFITILLMTLFGVVFMMLMQIIVGGILFSFESLSIPFVTFNTSTMAIEIVSIFKYMVLTTTSYLPKLILLGTLAFALSTIISSTAFAITITLFGAFSESIINALAKAYDIKFLNYFVTTNWNFNEFLFGGTSRFDLSLTHSIVICLIYFMIMLVVSFIVFKKKDIKNI